MILKKGSDLKFTVEMNLIHHKHQSIGRAMRKVDPKTLKDFSKKEVVPYCLSSHTLTSFIKQLYI